MVPFNTHPSSYRDPSGFLFYKNGVLYRQVNKSFSEEFDMFSEKGLYKHLVEKNILLSHTEVMDNLTGMEEWYTTLQPQPLEFISYPYEWCFEMLKDAALLTIDAAKEAVSFNMILKDASAYNVQWHNGEMIFIDTLSFEKYDERKPWIAYRQFCEHFFAPLALMHFQKSPLQQLFLSFPDGIPLVQAKKLLSLRSMFSLHCYLHIHLHGTVSQLIPQAKNKQDFSLEKFRNLLKSLDEGISSFKLRGKTGPWSGYYEEAFERQDYISLKKNILEDWLQKLSFETILDAGGNEGEFTEIAAKHAGMVICAEGDHYAVNRLYNKTKKKSIKNILPLIIDLANPSPSLGLNNEERPSFTERTHTDVVMALALVHHLAIHRNIPFDRIARLFRSLGKTLLVEFVPKEDEKIKLMLRNKRDVYEWYSPENFLASFSQYYIIEDWKEIGQTKRVLYLMQPK